MSEGRGISGVAVGVTLGGALFLYSGIKNAKLSDTIRSFIAGTPGAAVPLGSSGGTLAQTSGSATSAQTSANTSSISYFLTHNLAFSLAGAAGAMGNMQIESGFNTGSLNQREGAIGLCQWEGGRRTALQAYAAIHGLQETDLPAQLGYMQTELMSGEADVNLYMRGASDPGSAAAYWDARYERSDGTTRQKRIDAARGWYTTLSTGSGRGN